MNRVRLALAIMVSLAIGGAAWTSARAAAEKPSPVARGDLGVSCYVDAQFISDAQERRAERSAASGAPGRRR